MCVTTEHPAVTVGAVLPAMVTGTKPERGLTLQLPGGATRGSVHLTHISDAYKDNPVGRLRPGQFTQCSVLDHDPHTHTCGLSMRKSR